MAFMPSIGNCDKSGIFQVSVLNWIVLISADFVICLESNLVHLSKFESSWLGHHTTAAGLSLKVNCLFGWFQKQTIILHRWKDRSGVRLSKMEIGWPEAKARESVLINTSQDNKNIKDSETLFNSRF